MTVKSTIYQGYDGHDGQTPTCSHAQENEKNLPFSVGDKVWIGKRPGVITTPTNEHGEWKCKYISLKGEWKESFFSLDTLKARDAEDYAVGDKVWAITPDGGKLEAIITHPQDEKGKWGLKVKIGAMEEDWNGTYTYFSHDLEPR
ncbi:hypothetical protein PN466_02095 [Roseofilum reptotaenium CS-1145]|uniref:Uncharacterized protein n=1 Tax=Roseofilum reptotaenium AO1-A TaxID=1925591 RepID=A0A1L9QN62_9CYAN|nr:hypothetical protein [Roseofilum reptotaenium]MDB9515748.1 hypothetical protein [Roseofilum reptotaenium CS-1145]OJJ24089.1 hypothetical protein BI308_18625 [Roseofilum reptotaenium AO1-A]